MDRRLQPVPRMLPLLVASLALQPCRLIQFRYEAPALLLTEGWSADRVRLALATVVVPHPQGPLLLDPAVGAATSDEVSELPLLLRLQLRKIEKAPRLSLPQRPRAILLTHLHWDHAGGALDFPDSPVLALPQEVWWAQALARKGSFERGVLASQVRALGQRLQPISGARVQVPGLGAGVDVLGDRSVVAVRLPGHTPGSAGYLVADKWLFVGDAVWELRILTTEGRKARLARRATDDDADEAERTVAALRELQRLRPDLVLVPAHDLGALERLPECPHEPP
jgi:glyoxylase-like metal-dependent hydrolase (beta-lactamase superfamily II)